MKTKNIFILGDSYSTFTGYIPEGNSIYYREGGREDNDVTKVNETWWYSLAEELELNIVLNDSWSGSTVCHTGYGGLDTSKTSSFLFRIDRLINEGFFEKNKIDTVFIFGGTNDSWANSPIGELTKDDFSNENLFRVLPAFSYLFATVKKTLPEANIIPIVNSELKSEVTDGIKAAAKLYGIECVSLHNIDKSKGHPTVKGMAEIKNQIRDFIESNN